MCVCLCVCVCVLYLIIQVVDGISCVVNQRLTNLVLGRYQLMTHIRVSPLQTHTHTHTYTL